VSESLITLFAPYFGLQGTAASAYLAAHPLTLSLPNATTLSNQMETYFAQQVGARYNAASALNFFDLPMNTQTAVVDLAYQYGLNLAAATPNFWNQVTHGEWAAAYNNLRDFGDAYLSRRHDEASLIQADIQSGALTTAQ
jgi:GH24 family phage-related lysozyme (muramidase)